MDLRHFTTAARHHLDRVSIASCMVSTVAEEHCERVDCDNEAHLTAHTAKMSAPCLDDCGPRRANKDVRFGGAKRTEGDRTGLAPSDDR